MTLPAPTNCWTGAEAKIANAVANSAAFMALVGAGSATEAAQLVFGEQLDVPLNSDAYTPDQRMQELSKYAQVYSDQEEPYGKRRLQSQRMEAFGVAVLYIERLVADVERSAQANVPQYFERDFKNKVGTIIDEVISYLYVNGGPIIQTVAVDDGPGWNDRDRWPDEGAWQGCGAKLAWGLEG